LVRSSTRESTPNEVVAIGAAIQGAVLAGDVNGVLLLDVTPLSLDLETKGGVFTPLVERNTTIPTEKKETFTAAEDGQTGVPIRVYQGERPMAADNRLLGEFNLEGIPPAPLGTPQIEVSFRIDANGILQASAKDKWTGKEQTIKIESSGGLTKDEIDRMQRDAQAQAAVDKCRRELAEARNAAEQRVYQVEKLLKENQSRLTDADTAAVRSAIVQVNEATKGNERSAINRAIDDLQHASQAMMQHLQTASATAGSRAATDGYGHSPNGAGGRQSEEEIIDAEFEKK
jgi:molecular chaperone DnaK